MQPTRIILWRSIGSSGMQWGCRFCSSSPSWNAPLNPCYRWPTKGGVPTAMRSDRSMYKTATRSPIDRSVDATAFGQFLIAIFDEWVKRDVGEVFVQMFDVALANWYGEPPCVCVFSETCGQALALEHNGDLYSCDHFVEPDYHLGNITETPMIELVASEQQRVFGLAKRDTLPQYCRDCEVRFACHGGCPRIEWH